MQRSDVFVGDILRIINVKGYNSYDNYCNNENPYVELYRTMAVLVKKRNKYVYIMSVDSLLKEILFDLGIPLHKMSTKAINDGDLIVDEESLVPYYGQEELEKNKHVFSRSLRMKTILDPRLPGGIEL